MTTGTSAKRNRKSPTRPFHLARPGTGLDPRVLVFKQVALDFVARAQPLETVTCMYERFLEVVASRYANVDEYRPPSVRTFRRWFVYALDRGLI